MPIMRITILVLMAVVKRGKSGVQNLVCSQTIIDTYASAVRPSGLSFIYSKCKYLKRVSLINQASGYASQQWHILSQSTTGKLGELQQEGHPA